MRVAIVHYDISMRTGAQRLVLALGSVIAGLGHEIAYFTAHYDSLHSFPEFEKEKVFVLESRQTFLGRFRGLSALFGSKKMVEHGIQLFNPELFVFSSNYYLPKYFKPSIIYCHHPERLLVRSDDWMRRAFHYLIDREEKKGFQSASKVVSNSSFTKDAVKNLYGVDTLIAFPGVDLNKFKQGKEDPNLFILTVNRIVPNKNLELAIDAIGALKADGVDVPLTIAGTRQSGFEWYADKLITKIQDKKLGSNIQVRFNLTDIELIQLYQRCSIFLYTPEREHFGYGPVEAMACGKPVIAAPRGGPSETVIDGETGFIVAADPKQWAAKISDLLQDDKKRRAMGISARERIETHFSMDTFSNVVEKSINQAVGLD